MIATRRRWLGRLGQLGRRRLDGRRRIARGDVGARIGIGRRASASAEGEQDRECSAWHGPSATELASASQGRTFSANSTTPAALKKVVRFGLLSLLAACAPAAGDDPPPSDTETGTETGTTTGEPMSSESSASEPEMKLDVFTPPPDMPVEPPACCGCLCGDPTWSCSQETCLDDDGRALELRAEAGFLALERVEASREGVDYSVPPARIWYAFAPADEAPEDKPLLVLFNGGPGAATTAGLFAMNVGPTRVDTEADPPVVLDNPASWTAFANLLFVDARATGFSYELGTGARHFNPDQDAADFLRVIVRFLRRHPQLDASRVVIVGESYGGLRTVVMSHLLRGRSDLDDGLAPAAFRDPALHDELADFDVDRIDRFALIQGAIASFDQRSAFPDAMPECPGDFYACNEPMGDLDRRFEAAANALVDPAALGEALGVDPLGIEWMHAEARASMIRHQGVAPDDSAMRAAFGELEGGHYFLRMATLPFYLTVWWEGTVTLRSMLDAMRDTDWLATNAAQDQAVWMPVLPWALATDYPNVVDSVVETDGEIVVHYLDGEQRSIRFPLYPDAGHAVPAYAPDEIHTDLREWLASTD
jgi:hypothetical protein